MAATYASMTPFPLGTRPNIKKLSPQLPSVDLCGVGGSISFGYDIYLDSYRLQLHNLLTTRGGLSVTWVGCRTGGTAPANRTHALNGASIKDFGAGGIADMYAAPQNLGTTYTPNILIVEPVVNTAASDAETATWRADTVAALTAWCTTLPNMRLVLAGTFDAGNAARRTRIATILGVWDSMLSDLDTAGLNGRYVARKRMSSGINMDQTYNEALYDRVHLNDRGQLKWADDLFPMVMNAAGYDAVW